MRLFLLLFVFSFSHSFAQDTFTVNWPLTSDGTAIKSGTGAAYITTNNVVIGSAYQTQIYGSSGLTIAEGNASPWWIGKGGSSKPNDGFTGIGTEENRYIEFAIHADPGKDLKITEIKVPLSRGDGNGTLWFNVAYSFDNFTKTVYVGGTQGTAIDTENLTSYLNYTNYIVVPKGKTLAVRFIFWRRHSNNISSKTTLVLGNATISGIAQDVFSPNFHLYLLVGQSNMAGRGEISSEYVNKTHSRVLMLNANGDWVQAKHPLHFDKLSVAGVGPGLQFAMDMADNNPDITIGLIPAAVGGTAISTWTPGATDEATGLKPYDDAVARTQIALQRGILKGILFHQGEANSGLSNLNPWKTGVKNLADNLRTAFNTPNIPFIVGELGYFRATSSNINNILPQLVTEIPNSGMVSAQGLTDKGDGTHFDSNSADILGSRYAQKILELQQPTVLPLNIYAFTAQKSNNGILLKWKKEKSNGFKNISIERAGNDNNFKPISKQETDTETGLFMDVLPLNGDNYYRLKQTDNDGKYFYTKTVHQYYSLSGNPNLTLYPNPTDGKLYVQWSGCKGTSILHIYNMAGRKEKSISIANCSSAIDVSFLTNGIYIAKITNGNKILGEGRFIKR